MIIAAHNKFIHLCGQKGARLDHDHSIHGSAVNPRSILVKVLSPFLFWAPDAHLRDLSKIWVDRLAHRRPWKKLMTKLVTDWQEFNLPVLLFDLCSELKLTHLRFQATVLLSANMSFLAIQSVDNGGAKVKDRSAAQIASYISIVTSLGTVILSLLLVRQYRSKGSADDAVRIVHISHLLLGAKIHTGKILRENDRSVWPRDTSYLVCSALRIALVVVCRILSPAMLFRLSCLLISLFAIVPSHSSEPFPSLASLIPVYQHASQSVRSCSRSRCSLFGASEQPGLKGMIGTSVYCHGLLTCRSRAGHCCRNES